MSACFGKEATPAKMTQQDRMKDCNAKATGKTATARRSS